VADRLDEAVDFPALAVAPNGDVFVGTAPEGLVLKVSPDGSSEIYFETGQSAVWSLEQSNRYGLVVATGDSARLFAVDSGGEADVLYASDESSVSTVALGGDGSILAGTSPSGLLLEIGPGGDVRVLYDTRYEEVSGIVVERPGRAYFSATTVALDQLFDENGGGNGEIGEGSVYRTTDGGGVVELWSSRAVPVTSLGRGAGGSVWVGTGSGGRIYALSGSGEVDLATEVSDDQVISIDTSGGLVLVTTGLAGALYTGELSAAADGCYESEVLDTGVVARWGELRWRAEAPRRSHVRLFTRSGNTETPDRTWSGWTPVEGEGEGRVAAPPARFLQWKAELAAAPEGGGPSLRAVEVAYAHENLAPRVGRVTVYDPGDVSASVRGGFPDGGVTQTLPSGVEVTYSLDVSHGPAQEFPALLRGFRTVEWDAVDPDGDRLRFELWVRGEGEQGWKLLERDLDRTVHTWDSSSMPDGRYVFRVVASDDPDNPPREAACDEAVSGPFVVDNTPPVFDDLSFVRRDGRVVVSGVVRDALSPVSRVEVSVNYGDWCPGYADDSLFDSLEERFEGDCDGPGGDELSVAVRALDRSGNVAVVRRVME